MIVSISSDTFFCIIHVWNLSVKQFSENAWNNLNLFIYFESLSIIN